MRISDWGSDVCSSDHTTDVVRQSRGGCAGDDSRPHAARCAYRGGAEHPTGNGQGCRPQHQAGCGPRPRPSYAPQPSSRSRAQASGTQPLPVTGNRSFVLRSEEHTSELQSLMSISYAVFCLTKKTHKSLLTDTT